MAWFDLNKNRQSEADAQAQKKREEAEANTNKTIEAIQSNLREMNTRMDRLIERGFAQPSSSGNSGFQSTPASNPTPVQVAVDFTGLPDPVDDPENYHKELSNRVNKALQTGQQQMFNQFEQQQATAQTVQNQVSGLWDTFKSRFPDLMKHAEAEDWAEFSASKLANAAKAKGLNVRDYMFDPGSTFLDDVAADMKKTFGPLIEAADKAGDNPPGGDNIPQGGKAEKDPHDLEPAAVMSGQRSPAVNGKAPVPDSAGSLAADLNEVQRHDGYF